MGLPAGIRHFGFAAEHRRRHGNANLRVEILPLALEPCVGRHVDAEVQIP